MPPVPKPPKAKNDASPSRNRNLIIAVVAAAVVAVVLIVGAIAFTGGGGNSGSEATASTSANGATSGGADAVVKGIPQNGTVLGDTSKAKVTLLLYEDLQCPFCREFTEGALPTLIDEYVRSGKVKIDWRGMDFLGDDSKKALKIALAAGKQNKLWDVTELLYAHQGAENSGWVTDDLVDEVLAQVPGLDAAQVKKDAASAAIEKQAAEIQAEASANGVNGTPSFFIVTGVNKPYQIQAASLTSPDAFRPALDDALSG
jgi:protein-disulfide isomerase